MKSLLPIMFFIVAFLQAPQSAVAQDPYAPGAAKKWLRTARIAAPEFDAVSDNEITRILKELEEQGVNAVDLDFSYDPLESQLHLINKILKIGRKNHPDMKFFVYQAPLEKVSENVDMNRDGKVDAGKTSFYTQHPHWAQRGFGDEPALYYGADAQAFWVGKHDEDVWLCPNDPEYQRVWQHELEEIAGTGVDGIYIDVPFLRGYFDDSRGWLWACSCPDCQEKYRAEFGVDLPAKEKWDDPNFQRFINWRFGQIRDFLKAARAAVKRGNPKAAFIVEHWNCVSDAAEYGLDPEMLKTVSDVRAHEWCNVNGSTSDYHSYSWLEDMVRYLYYRAVDGSQPTWLLAYADKNDSDASKSLAALQFAAGFNFWETEAPDMAGSVDIDSRTEIFSWINRNSPLYYRNKTELVADVALYFSRNSITFDDFRNDGYPSAAWEEFAGTGMMLLQEHIPFKVVTNFKAALEDVELLFLPGISCLSDAETDEIAEFLQAGGKAIITGRTGSYDQWGNKRKTNALSEILKQKGVTRTTRQIGSDYYLAAAPDKKKPRNHSKAERKRRFFRERLLEKSGYQCFLETDAPADVILLVWKRGKDLQIRAFDAESLQVKDKVFNIDIDISQLGTPGTVKYYSWLNSVVKNLMFNINVKVMSFSIELKKHGVAKILFQ